jgi:hypothetical protein
MAQITVTRQADCTFRVQTPAGTSHRLSACRVSPPALAAVTSNPGNFGLAPWADALHLTC